MPPLFLRCPAPKGLTNLLILLNLAIFVVLNFPFNSRFSEEVQSLPASKRFKKAVPGSPEYASQASVVTTFVCFLFLYQIF